MRIKDIPGFEGQYLITDTGDVISVYRQLTDKAGRLTCKPSKVLAAAPDPRGYRIVHLYRDDGSTRAVAVHRLVAEAFLPNKGDQVNHIDGDRGNNHHTNLEWCTASGNQFHRHARKRHVRLSASEIMQIRESYGTVATKALADKFGVDRSTVWRLAHGGRHKDGDRVARQKARGLRGAENGAATQNRTEI